MIYDSLVITDSGSRKTLIVALLILDGSVDTLMLTIHPQSDSKSLGMLPFAFTTELNSINAIAINNDTLHYDNYWNVCCLYAY